MRFPTLLIIALSAGPSAAQQLGYPMSEMPGVETIQNGQQAQPSAATQTVEGVVLPQSVIKRLTAAVPGVSGASTAQDIGVQIERSFYERAGDTRSRADAKLQNLMQGASPNEQRELEAARAVAGDVWAGTRPRGTGAVTVDGVTISLPPSQSLMPGALTPGFLTTRKAAGGTGVSNLFTGSGVPRASDPP